MNRDRQLRVEPDRARGAQPVKDGRECASARLAGRLPHPGKNAHLVVGAINEQPVQQVALACGEFSGQQLGDVALGVEQRLGRHPLHQRDAGHDDPARAELGQEHAREIGAAGRGQRDRQQPRLQRRPGGPVELPEPEHVVQRVELLVAGRPAHGIVGEHVGRDVELVGDERERGLAD